MLKNKSSVTSLKLGSQGFWRIANSVLNKGKSVIPPLFNNLEVSSSISVKAKLFAKNFFMTSNLDDSGIPLPTFSSNPKVHSISIIPKVFKKVITNLDSSKACGPDCIRLVLKNCESKLSYILAALFNMCLKKFVLRIVGRSHWCFLYLRMLGKGLPLKTTARLLFFQWKVFSQGF